MQRKFLNVGGGSKKVAVPPIYEGWEHLLLDIDPKGNPDVCLDARELATLEGGQFDAIYGHGPEIEASGVDFYAHKTGFTRKSLGAALNRAGFPYLVFTQGRNREIAVRGFKQMPSEEQKTLIGVKAGS